MTERVPLKRYGSGYHIGDYVFVKNLQKKYKNGVPYGKIFLKCQEWKKSCKARASYDPASDDAKVTNPFHNHDPPCISAMIFRGQVLAEVKKPSNTRASLSTIFTQAKNEVLKPITNRSEREELAKKLPKYPTIQPSLSMARSDVAPLAPKDRKDIDIDFIRDAFKTADGEPFLLRDTGENDPGRILILGLPQADLARFGYAKSIAMDGTFWATPVIFKQVFTIFVDVYGHMFPAIICLLPDKLESTYMKMFWNIFDILSQRGIRFNCLKTVISDFEMALINSVKHWFGPIHQGCFFHYAQAIYRKVAKMFGAAYKNDAQFREIIRMFIALGHVPAVEKEAYFQQLYHTYVRDDRIRQFADQYFWPTWFGLFPTHLWDWFNVDRRTNNIMEGWHGGLKTFLVAPHLTLYRFMTLMLAEVDKKTHDLAGLIANPRNPRKDAKWAVVDAQYKAKWSRFKPILVHNPPIVIPDPSPHPFMPLDYLRSIAHAVPGPVNNMPDN